MIPEILKPHSEILADYRDALQTHEYLALECWLTTFWPFQLEWLLDHSRLAVCNKARQIGMSHTTSAFAVLWGAFHGELTTVISIAERESKEVLDKAKRHRDVLVSLGSKMAGAGKVDTATTLDFASGGKIMALPSSGGRSFAGNAFIDEHAYLEHPSEVWDAALAVTMHGFRARVASTPNGVGNEYHQLWTDWSVKNGWSRHEFPIQRALSEGMDLDMEFLWSLAKGDQRLFDQLFNCKFLDGEMQYIPSGLIEDCMVDSLGDGDGNYFAGLDIGKTADLTVLYVVKKCGDVRHTVYVETCKRTDSAELHGMVDRAFEKFDLHKLCVDATGLGSFPADEMVERHGYYSVEPVKFTLQSKEEMATSLYSAIQGKTLLLPKTDAAMPTPPDGMRGVEPGIAKAIFDDLCSIRRVVTTAGNVRYDAPHTDKGHADRAWAAALALHASSGEQARGYVQVA